MALKGQKLRFALVCVCIGATAILSLLPQQLLSYVIDTVLGGANEGPTILSGLLSGLLSGGTVNALARCAFFMTVISGVGGLFQYASGRMAAVASETMAMNMRARLYEHMDALSYEKHIAADTGDLLQRCTSDVETVRKFFATQIEEIFRSVCMIAFACVIMLSMDVKMTLISLASVPLLAIFSFLYYSAVQKRFLEADEAEGRLSTALQENLTGMRVVRAFAAQAHEAAKFDAASREYRDLWRRLIDLLALFWGVSDTIIYGQIGAVIVCGCIFVMRGEISLGALTAFVSYTALLLAPVRQMGRLLADWGKTFVSLGRVGEILDMAAERDAPGAATPEIRGACEFDGVRFSYGGREVLRGVSFRAEPGETVAVLGATGSGKTTLMHLLPRLYDVDGGVVRIDGVDVREIKRKWLRRHVALVLQEPFLYSRTIRENIGITMEEIDDEAVVAAAKAAMLHGDIMGFENGYDTLVGEKGVTLSGGQKQRVAIARALVQNAPVLILDDSLSALDAETDVLLRARLKERRGTLFIISHRMSTLREADKIVVLEDGAVAQTGTHEELASREGLYRRVWRIQSAAPGDGADEETR